MIEPRLRPLETVSTQTLLGIRFWDRLIASPVAQGLRVTAQRVDAADPTRRLGKPVLGQITPSGIVAFFGLSAAERPLVDSAELLWDNPPVDQFVAIDGVDLQGRYLPLSFVARLPQRGPFRGEGEWLTTPLLRPISPAGAAPGVYLWSTPTRTVPPGATAIRAQLVVGDGDNPAPAAYALAEVVQPADDMAPEFRYFGLADGRGTLLLPLPYPPVPAPEGSEFPPLAQQRFNLTLTIYHSATAQVPLPGSSVPNLTTLLTQPPAQIGTHFDAAEPPVLQTVPSLAINLPFDQPQVLRTAIGSPDAGTRESVLRILP